MARNTNSWASLRGIALATTSVGALMASAVVVRDGLTDPAAPMAGLEIAELEPATSAATTTPELVSPMVPQGGDEHRNLWHRLFAPPVIGLAAAVLLGGIAAMIKLFGAGRALEMAAAAAPKVKKALKNSASIAADVGKSVARSVMKPLRHGVLMVALALLAFAGIGYFDLEWFAMLGAGAGLAMSAMLKSRQVLAARIWPQKII